MRGRERCERQGERQGERREAGREARGRERGRDREKRMVEEKGLLVVFTLNNTPNDTPMYISAACLIVPHYVTVM